VRFGSAEPIELLRNAGAGRTEEEAISAALRERVAALGAGSVTAYEAADTDSAEGRADTLSR